MTVVEFVNKILAKVAELKNKLIDYLASGRNAEVVEALKLVDKEMDELKAQVDEVMKPVEVPEPTPEPQPEPTPESPPQ